MQRIYRADAVRATCTQLFLRELYYRCQSPVRGKLALGCVNKRTLATPGRIVLVPLPGPTTGNPPSEYRCPIRPGDIT